VRVCINGGNRTASIRHAKAVVIDDSIIYVGSINLLHIVTLRYVPADYMMRFVSEALVDEVLEKFMPGYQEWLE